MKMSLGEKAILHITSDYGYGTQGAGGVIVSYRHLYHSNKQLMYMLNSRRMPIWTSKLSFWPSGTSAPKLKAAADAASCSVATAVNQVNVANFLVDKAQIRTIYHRPLRSYCRRILSSLALACPSFLFAEEEPALRA